MDGSSNCSNTKGSARKIKFKLKDVIIKEKLQLEFQNKMRIQIGCTSLAQIKILTRSLDILRFWYPPKSRNNSSVTNMESDNV